MRKILIVPVGKIDEFQQMALENDVPEIVEGIPKGLAHLYNEEDLPVIHTEEPEPPQPPSKTELLRQENAFLFLELARATERAEAAEKANADLTLELVKKGVL